jgi:energy-coupling factor transporter transmembrane protein EcfT
VTSAASRRISPPGRLLAAVVLVAGIATSPVAKSRAALAMALTTVALTLLWARPRPRWLLRRAAAALLAVATLVVPFLLADSAGRAREVALRASLALLLTLAVASTLRLAELPNALVSLRLPRELASTVHALLWQLEHVADEGRRLVLARRLRGARSAYGAEVLSEMLTRTAARAERVELAVALRGGSSLGPRKKLGTLDLVAVAACLALAMAIHVVS